MKVKTSYGIALCRYNPEKNNNVEILMIKKRYTYHFFNFVFGKYKKNDINTLKHLFNNMSFAEKIDILGLQFNYIWYRIWLNNPEKNFNIKDNFKIIEKSGISNADIYKQFFQKKNQFEKNFLLDGGRKLKNLIKDSSDSELIWEIPKGAKNHNETNIDAAIREFKEETSIPDYKYTILYNIKPVVESFIDIDVQYINIYYLAVLNKETELKINFANYEQIKEVEQIKWISIEDVRFLKLNKITSDKLIKTFKQISNKFKNYNKFMKINTNLL